MANEDIHNEMALLRNELEALKKERESEQISASSDKDNQASADSTETIKNKTEMEDVCTDNAETPEDLALQVKSFIESMDKDINETKPVTLLAVFALGVLVGRL